jgi:serine/threonine protein kinase
MSASNEKRSRHSSAKDAKSESNKQSSESVDSVSRKDGWQHYRKIQVLGEGSYGKVYKVQKRAAPSAVSNARKKQSIFDDPLNLQMKEQAATTATQFLVIKELQTDLMPKKEALAAMDEIDILAQLAESAHIVKYYDSFVSGTKVNIVMEYCENGDL